jgi:hypothetical protein
MSNIDSKKHVSLEQRTAVMFVDVVVTPSSLVSELDLGKRVPEDLVWPLKTSVP